MVGRVVGGAGVVDTLVRLVGNIRMVCKAGW